MDKWKMDGVDGTELDDAHSLLTTTAPPHLPFFLPTINGQPPYPPSVPLTRPLTRCKAPPITARALLFPPPESPAGPSRKLPIGSTLLASPTTTRTLEIENEIDGEVLVHLDHEALKDLGVKSMGHRLSLLKEIYNLKIAHGVPIDPDHFVPLSAEDDEEAQYTEDTVDVSYLTNALLLRDERIQSCEMEIRKLSESLSKLREDPLTVFRLVKDSKPLPIPEASSGSLLSRKFSTKKLFLGTPRTQHSPTYDHQGSPPESPRSPLNDQRTPTTVSSPKIPDKRQPFPPPKDTEPFKSFRVSLEDPCWKVLPAALKRYKIHGDWRGYALFICYGDQERCLGLDEKPLLLFQQLQREGKNPVFMLRQMDGSSIHQPPAPQQAYGGNQRYRDGVMML
ncbi:Protein STE50 [Neolecta irregularis DAH-3]|uniref:Protein STE50 n=1 Tax=Neolecta irregularis (strain DAH-3) TaxID=1198029 RepID=A0A1U7LV92_NEOID|nr:Protein STE50 [Neolecta irregularis DAH-3]|eukprot:OLL26595.1 Protein STE50 [Neolecta irregularis DAH-3]